MPTEAAGEDRVDDARDRAGDAGASDLRADVRPASPASRASPAGPVGRDREDTGMRLAAGTWEALLRAEVTLMRVFESSDDFYPLSKTEYDVLFILATAPGRSLRMRDLNEQVLMAQPSLSRMADRLAAKGYLRRAPAINDARGTNLVLTEEGLEMQRSIGRRHVRTIHRVMSALDDDELRELRYLLRKVRAEAPPAPARGRRRD